ncbi:hypothetical protein [Fibrella aestuarina]|nr:hypothetical protein [Fibrella aestuarina]
MESHEEATDLLDNTMGTLTQDVAELTPQSGKGMIDQWIKTLTGPENTKEIVASLEHLKTQLEAGQPNAGEVQKILTELANQTREMSVMAGPEGDIVTRLEALAAALQTASGQIGNA